MTTCTKCGVDRSEDEFYRRNGKLRRPCKSCDKDGVAKWRASNRERRNRSIALHNAEHPDAHQRTLTLMRERNLKKWNLTIALYDKLLAAQGGGCAICGATDPGGGRTNFCVDHDHGCCDGNRSCGRCIRGLLCLGCNRALGLFKDNPVALIAAALYLEVSDAPVLP